MFSNSFQGFCPPRGGDAEQHGISYVLPHAESVNFLITGVTSLDLVTRFDFYRFPGSPFSCFFVLFCVLVFFFTPFHFVTAFLFRSRFTFNLCIRTSSGFVLCSAFLFLFLLAMSRVCLFVFSVSLILCHGTALTKQETKRSKSITKTITGLYGAPTALPSSHGETFGKFRKFLGESFHISIFINPGPSLLS